MNAVAVELSLLRDNQSKLNLRDMQAESTLELLHHGSGETVVAGAPIPTQAHEETDAGCYQQPLTCGWEAFPINT